MAVRTQTLRWSSVVVAVLGSVAMAQGASALVAPSVPAAIQVPAGNTPFLSAHAVGLQVYTCVNSGSGFAWVLQTPLAALTDDSGATIIVHYGGPTWRSVDGSSVVGARVDGVPAPVPGAIPWLLLRAASTTAGPGGGTTLTPTTYIQRINTTGGVAPTTGCDAAHAGATTGVPYTADYWFFKATGTPSAR
jgi:hypothetical protein